MPLGLYPALVNISIPILSASFSLERVKLMLSCENPVKAPIIPAIPTVGLITPKAAVASIDASMGTRICF